MGTEDLIERIEPRYGWGDLVLPGTVEEQLRVVASQLAGQQKAFGEWGFAAKHGIRGSTALFEGPPGTGKSMAAQVLAGDLGMPLYRVDLGSVSKKYIGETEKNLGKVLDASAPGGSIVLFDEADALFGKRSKAGDGADRPVESGLSFLLSSAEAMAGLAIFSTHLRRGLDRGFVRRFGYVVRFPFPDPAERERIWSGVFPHETPTEGIDASALAWRELSGGEIVEVAARAALLAASADEPVRMSHLETAVGEFTDRSDQP